jgi:large subunit ribosomal protein L10
MPTEAKRQVVEELREELSRSTAIIATDYRGLTVKDLGAIRKSLRAQNVSYHVVKNRLLRIAADEARAEALTPLLEGPSAFAFAHGDEAAAAKALLDAIKPYTKIVAVRGAVIGTSRIDADGVTRLATLPARPVLLGQLAGAMSQPISQLGGLLGANLRNLGYALSQVRDRKAAEA